MNGGSGSLMRKLVVVTLLLLVVSPVTAPFSTYHLTDLEGTPAKGAAAFQAKPAPDDSTASIYAVPELGSVAGARHRSPIAAFRHARWSKPLSVPLRI